MVQSKKRKQEKDTAEKKISVKKSVEKNKKVSKPKQVNRSKIKKPKQAGSPKKKSASKKNNSVIVLSAVMVINEVALLHKKLIKLSASRRTVTLDASKVEMIDTAAIQLLLAFVITMNKKGVSFVWKNPSREFLERTSILNLTAALCLGEVKE